MLLSPLVQRIAVHADACRNLRLALSLGSEVSNEITERRVVFGWAPNLADVQGGRKLGEWLLWSPWLLRLFAIRFGFVAHDFLLRFRFTGFSTMKLMSRPDREMVAMWFPVGFAVTRQPVARCCI